MLLPRGDRTEPFWLSERDDAVADMQTRSTIPDEVDIVVIGSGISGAIVVHHLTKSDWTPRILLLDAQRLCEGATARNGGHCKPLTYLGFRAEAAKHGAEVADQMYSFEASALSTYAALVQSEDLDCDMHATRACDVFFDATDAAEAKKDYDARMRLYPDSMKRDDVREVNDREELERLTGIRGAHWGCHYPAGHLWPYKLATQLITKSVARCKGKLDVFTKTPVLEVQSAGQGYTLKTSKGTVKAHAVVACSNAWTSGILPIFQDKIVPVRGTVCSVSPSANHRLGAVGEYGPLKMSYGIRHRPGEMDYLIPRQGRGRVPGMGDQSIILGGAKGVFNRDIPAWYNNNDDSTLIPGTRSYFDKLLPRIFKGWKVGEADAKGKVQSIWTGVLGYSHDLLPYVGRIAPGLYVSAGFTGHGMPRIPACSEAIAKMVLSDLQQQQGQSTPYHDEVFERDIPRPYHFSTARLRNPVNLILGALGVSEKQQTVQRESNL